MRLHLVNLAFWSIQTDWNGLKQILKLIQTLINNTESKNRYIRYISRPIEIIYHIIRPIGIVELDLQLFRINLSILWFIIPDHGTFFLQSEATVTNTQAATKMIFIRSVWTVNQHRPRKWNIFRDHSDPLSNFSLLFYKIDNRVCRANQKINLVHSVRLSNNV